MDPKGGYGVAVVSVNSEEYLKELIADDPTNGLSTYEAYPMTALRKRGSYPLNYFIVYAILYESGTTPAKKHSRLP